MILLFLLLLFPISANAEYYFTVASVINGKSFVTTSGDTVRLASIEAPNVQEQDTPARKGRPGEPLGEEAKHALSTLILGKKIRINYNPGTRDRHGRLLGQVYDDKGRWVQAEMLKEGWVMVYSFNDDSHDIIEKMLTAEKQARTAKRGLWADPYYRIITPEETSQFIDRFKLVEGKVVSVHEYHGNMYINFNEHWKGNFYVFISHTYMDEFSSWNLYSLKGKTVCVHGWLHYHNASMIDITRPEQVEIE